MVARSAVSPVESDTIKRWYLSPASLIRLFFFFPRFNIRKEKGLVIRIEILEFKTDLKVIPDRFCPFDHCCKALGNPSHKVVDKMKHQRHFLFDVHLRGAINTDSTGSDIYSRDLDLFPGISH